MQVFSTTGKDGVAVVQLGKIVCYGTTANCAHLTNEPDHKVVNLMGGSLSPALMTFGSPLGLGEIMAESSTTDGIVLDSLVGEIPKVLGGSDAIFKASDGLQFQTRHAL